MLTNLLSQGTDVFARAATSLVDVLHGFTIDLKPTTISRFKASYGEVLQNANQGRIQVIAQGKKRYLLLSEEQVIALAQQSKKPRMLGELVRSIKAPVHPLGQSSLHLKRSKTQQVKLPPIHGNK